MIGLGLARVQTPSMSSASLWRAESKQEVILSRAVVVNCSARQHGRVADQRAIGQSFGSSLRTGTSRCLIKGVTLTTLGPGCSQCSIETTNSYREKLERTKLARKSAVLIPSCSVESPVKEDLDSARIKNFPNTALRSTQQPAISSARAQQEKMGPVYTRVSTEVSSKFSFEGRRLFPFPVTVLLDTLVKIFRSSQFKV